MRRFILTGAPGAGKTTVARLLLAAGHTVVDEAATDLITASQAAGEDTPWEHPGFTDRVAALQRDRQIAADTLPGPDQWFDRSPVCALALARYTGAPVGPVLAAELDRIETEAVYEPRVLLFDLLDAIEATPVRRIDLDGARRFAQVHVDAYTERGYTIVRIPPAPPAERARLVLDATQ
ncbi:AAA family ATPase [Glycomyces sp. NPDC048151]|uniref:AAA family ATPase n=1 Tax=Glycomyces sp. NPDC048151 TaxID=3364002 RepID=UPI003721F499